MDTNAIIIDPETVDIPAVIRINNSFSLILDKYGLTKRGASTCPMMIFAVAPNPIGPPILKSFSNIFEIDLIISGNIFQNQSNAERLEITIIKENLKCKYHRISLIRIFKWRQRTVTKITKPQILPFLCC